MSKILRRPMFRGGPVSSYGNGIATGLADGGRVGYQVGGPIYPAGYSAVPDGGITGADIKKMAEKKVFMSGFGKDTAQLNSTLKDLYMNYIQSPLEKGGNKFIDYMAGTEFEDKDSPFFGNQKDFKRIYDRDVMPEATKLSNELIPQISSEDEYEEAYMTPAEVDLRNEQRKKSYIDNAVSSNREEAIMNKDYSEMKKVLDKQRADPYEGKGGGKDAAESDFEIPVGVTEVEGEETVDGGAVGYKELADSYFDAMQAGSDERLAERLAAADERSAGRLKKARIEDLSDIGLDIFRRTVGEGKDIKQALGESAGRMIDKPSRSEKEKDRGDIRREKLEDAAANREEGRFDAATQMAFKELMQDKGFDFKDLQSEKTINSAMERLKLQLETTENVAEKRIIAQRMRDLESYKQKTYAPGITQKDIEYAASLDKNSAEYSLWLNKNDYAATLEAQINKRSNDMTGSPMSVNEINATGPIYYKDWKGTYSGQTDDGTYLDVTNKKIITFSGGELIKEEIIKI